jgi:hypothetical protein
MTGPVRIMPASGLEDQPSSEVVPSRTNCGAVSDADLKQIPHPLDGVYAGFTVF